MHVFSRLFNEVIAACRHHAAKLESFASGDGAIRITLIPQGAPLTDLADMPYSADRYEFTARITPHGNYVLNRANPDEPPVDTYAFSAMKTAAYLRQYEANHSGEPKLREDCGFACYRGPVGYDIYMNHRIVALLIVCVSGGTEDEDEKVAMAAKSAIAKWCESNKYSYSLSDPRA